MGKVNSTNSTAAADAPAADAPAADAPAADAPAADAPAADAPAADAPAADAPAADAPAANAQNDDMANVAARNAGFVDAEAQVSAMAAATRSPKARKKPTKPKALLAKVVDGGIDEARDLMTSGELEIGFGDNVRLNVDIPKVAASMIANGPKINNQDLVVLRTQNLHRTTTVTYAYLLHGKRVLAARELGAPIRIEPGLQITFKSGTLSFS